MNAFIEFILFIVVTLVLFLIEKNKVDSSEKEPEVKTKPTIDIYVEQLGDIYYAWENNRQFLFQHEDPNEVAKMLIRKYPNHKLNIYEKSL